jgi:hypothetical protein
MRSSATKMNEAMPQRFGTRCTSIHAKEWPVGLSIEYRSTRTTVLPPDSRSVQLAYLISNVQTYRCNFKVGRRAVQAKRSPRRRPYSSVDTCTGTMVMINRLRRSRLKTCSQRPCTDCLVYRFRLSRCILKLRNDFECQGESVSSGQPKTPKFELLQASTSCTS